MIRCAAAAGLCVLGLPPWGAAAVAQAPARVFTIAGIGQAGEPRSGSIASAVPVGLEAPEAVAAMPDGGFAFTTRNAVWAMRRSGRLHLVTRRRSPGGPTDVAAAPDGSVYVAYDNVAGGSVHRIFPGGEDVLVVRAPEPCAVRAIDLAEDGSLLFASCTSVWRLAPGGAPQRVAGRALDPDGFRPAGPVPEGSPALGVPILAPTVVAALADGGFLFSETERHVWRVTAQGTIQTFITRPTIGLQALPDGSVLFTDVGQNPPSRLWRRDSDGRESVIAGTGRAVGGFDGDAGSPLAAPVDAGALAVTRDGGVVFVDGGRIRYLPPATPGLLAVGIARSTISTRRRVRVAVRTTVPATVSAAVIHAGREVLRGRATSTSTGVVIPMSRALAGGVYEVRVRASSAGRSAADAVTMIVGRTLPLPYVQRLLVDEAIAFERENAGFLDRIGPCRHFGRARVDCADVGPVGGDPLCQTVDTFILRRDGLVARGDYGGGTIHCRLHARPHYTHRPQPFELPVPARR